MASQEPGRQSLRAKLADARALAGSQFKALKNDQSGETNVAATLLQLGIGAVIFLFVTFLLFGIIGPDANNICTDTTNYSAEECDQATQARELFWTFVVISMVVFLIVAIGIARKHSK